MPVAVLVNLTALDPQRNGGASRIAWHVSRLLLEMPGVRPVFVTRAGYAAEFTPWLGARAVILPMLMRSRLLEGQVRTFTEAIAPDMIISPLFGADPFHHAGRAHVAFLPDTLALDHPEYFSPQDAHARRLIDDRLRRADAIVTLSAFASAQLQAHGLPAARVRVIPPGADNVDAAGVDETGVPPGRFWLYPANLWPHKRHGLLLGALAHARQRGHDVRLVLTGHPDGLEALQAQAQALGLPDHALQHCGYVSDARLHALYRRAEALLFPSSYEGCGMPLLEAMRAGCPVICAPRAAIPEVVGEAALMVQPDDSPQAWASAALDVLPARRQALIEAGRAHAHDHTWQAARVAWRSLLLQTGLREDPDAPPDAMPDQTAALNALRMSSLDSGRMRRLMGTPWLWRAQRTMLAQAAVYAGRQPPA